MKTLLTFLCIIAFNSNIFSQTDVLRVSQDGVVVVEFNASWNKAKNVLWVKDLKDCKSNRLLIDKAPKMASKYKIVVVPTIVVFKDGEETSRFQANIMMDMEATLKEVQEAIDEAHMEGF